MTVSSYGQFNDEVHVCMGGSAVLSLLFVYPEFPNTKLLAI